MWQQDHMMLRDLQAESNALHCEEIVDDDKAIDFTCDEQRRRLPDRTVPTDAIRAAVAGVILKQVDSAQLQSHVNQCYEAFDGETRLSRSGLAHNYPFCKDFGECGCSGCGCNRLSHPHGRRRFADMVTRRAEVVVGGKPVRYVTLGAGSLLTDFEILLGLWSRGLAIESIVAVDEAYSRTHKHHEQYHRALMALGVFFSSARVTAFASSGEYQAAASANPRRFAESNLFVWCDAAAVPREVFTSCALAALAPGQRAFELSNSGGRAHGHRGLHEAPLISYLPAALRPLADSQRHYSMSAYVNEAADRLAETAEPLIDQDRDVAVPLDDFRAAKTHLEATARQRAAAEGARLFTVVFDTSRVPVRKAPSRAAEIAGARGKGEEVIVEEVRSDGWVRLSPLDTWLGWERHADALDGQERFMLTSAHDVGEILREVVLDEHGHEIDDEAWMPELM